MAATTALPNPSDRAAAAHLLHRATFGPAPGEIDRLLAEGTETFLERQLAPAPEPEPVAAKLRALPSLDNSVSEFVLRHQRDAQSFATVACPIEDLRTAKLIRAVESPNQLREVMADFWYNHFNVYIYAWPPSVPTYERETIRPRVFGRFRDLLGAVAESPAMTYYLDTFISTANRNEGGRLVKGLNENYGRELLELHTVGVSAGYSQEDVTEAARCFTGWDFGGWYAPLYGFRFAHDNHDRGTKRVFGLEIPADGGQSDGYRLLDYLAAHPATARFLSWRLVQRLVADDPPQTLVTRCAEVFRKTDGNVADVLRTIFASEEFWSRKTFRQKVKSPLEFAASAVRALGGSVTDGKPLADTLGDMGMPLYECKPPTGYSNRSTDWVNVSAQIHRMNFAIALASNAFRGVRHGQPPRTASAFEREVTGESLDERTRRAVNATKGSTRVMSLLLASPSFQMK